MLVCWVLSRCTLNSLEPSRRINPLSYNLSRVNQVIEDGGVHRLESTGDRPLLFQLVSLPGGLGRNPPLGNEHHMLPREFLLQLADQSGLDLLESLQLWNWDKDDDGFLASATIPMLGRSDVELPQLSFQVRVDLQL